MHAIAVPKVVEVPTTPLPPEENPPSTQVNRAIRQDPQARRPEVPKSPSTMIVGKRASVVQPVSKRFRLRRISLGTTSKPRAGKTECLQVELTTLTRCPARPHRSALRPKTHRNSDGRRGVVVEGSKELDQKS